MVITISPTHRSSSSHTGALPAGGRREEFRRQRGGVAAQRTEPVKEGTDDYR